MSLENLFLEEDNEMQSVNINLALDDDIAVW